METARAGKWSTIENENIKTRESVYTKSQEEGTCV